MMSPGTKTQQFAGLDLMLAADDAGNREGMPVIFAHGGGQTRASWGAAVTAVGAAGYYAVSIDLRGHGDSDWSQTGDYSIAGFVGDLRSVATSLGRPAIFIGASLGGLASLVTVAEMGSSATKGLVLVDVAPRIEAEGSARILAFMTGNPEGFASVDEAADAVSAYVPHRPRPKDNRGLMKNLRLGEDGRYRWHWDPRLLGGTQSFNPLGSRDFLDNAARSIRVPTLLLRGQQSAVVSLEGVKHFLSLVPDAEFVDIPGADHMIAGDRNDAFNSAIIAFLTRHFPTKSS